MKNLIFFFALLIGSMSFAPTQAVAAASFGITPAATTAAAPVQKTVKKTSLLQKIKKALAAMDTVVLVILAILIPPLAVYLKENAIGMHFWISLILSCLFWIPGVIYALYIVLAT
jgi:uncharacterized membrane protein YqaE (UPF0057 family)